MYRYIIRNESNNNRKHLWALKVFPVFFFSKRHEAHMPELILILIFEINLESSLIFIIENSCIHSTLSKLTHHFYARDHHFKKSHYDIHPNHNHATLIEFIQDVSCAFYNEL